MDGPGGDSTAAVGLRGGLDASTSARQVPGAGSALMAQPPAAPDVRDADGRDPGGRECDLENGGGLEAPEVAAGSRDSR